MPSHSDLEDLVEHPLLDDLDPPAGAGGGGGGCGSVNGHSFVGA